MDCVMMNITTKVVYSMVVIVVDQMSIRNTVLNVNVSTLTIKCEIHKEIKKWCKHSHKSINMVVSITKLTCEKKLEIKYRFALLKQVQHFIKSDSKSST